MPSAEEPAAGKLHYSYIFKGLSQQKAKALQSRGSVSSEMPEYACKAAVHVQMPGSPLLLLQLFRSLSNQGSAALKTWGTHLEGEQRRLTASL